MDAVHMYDALTRGSPGVPRVRSLVMIRVPCGSASPSACGKRETVYARSCARTTFMLQDT